MNYFGSTLNFYATSIFDSDFIKHFNSAVSIYIKLVTDWKNKSKKYYSTTDDYTKKKTILLGYKNIYIYILKKIQPDRAGSKIVYCLKQTFTLQDKSQTIQYWSRKYFLLWFIF